MSTIRKKLYSHRGFSLTEMLICVVLLALMTAAGVTVSAAVLSTRSDMLETADAQILASTVLEAVANEIRYGEDVAFDAANKLTLTSTTFGEKTEFMPTAGRVTVTSAAIDTDRTDGVRITEPLLPDAAYTSLRVTGLTFEAKDGSFVLITVTVQGRGTQSWSKELTVTPLNGLITVPI